MGIHEDTKKKINAKEQGAFTCSVEGMRLINCWTNAHKELSQKYEELQKAYGGAVGGADGLKEQLKEKINERLYELRGMEGSFRDGQRSVFEWVLRELR